MWLYNAWADRVEGHVSFTKTMKREEGRGKEKEKEKKDSEEKGGRTKAEDRPRVTYNGSPTAESVIKHTQKTKTTWKTQKKKTTQIILLCSVWESMSVSMCAYHEAYLIMSHKNVPQKPEADSDPWYPAPPRPFKNTEQPRSHIWMTTVCSLKEYKIIISVRY